MRYTCDEIFGNQYRQLRYVFVPLCLESHDRYYFNVLIIITLLYRLYIEYKIYEWSYLKIEVISMIIALWKIQ